jgi:hypothetical protein
LLPSFLYLRPSFFLRTYTTKELTGLLYRCDRWERKFPGMTIGTWQSSLSTTLENAHHIRISLGSK